MATFCVDLPDEEKRLFMLAADYNDLSASQVLRAYIRQYIKEQKENGTLTERNS